MKTCILGTGYVGLTVGACLACLKHHVTWLDVNEKKNAFHEPGLPELLKLGSNRIKFTTDFSEGLSGADVVFIAVGTPNLPNGNPDLRYVLGKRDSHRGEEHEDVRSAGWIPKVAASSPISSCSVWPA